PKHAGASRPRHAVDVVCRPISTLISIPGATPGIAAPLLRQHVPSGCVLLCHLCLFDAPCSPPSCGACPARAPPRAAGLQAAPAGGGGVQRPFAFPIRHVCLS